MESDTKFCTSCGEKILRKAVICPKCGCAQANFNGNYYSEKNRVMAALLAFFIGPFGGHWFYIGKKKDGILLLIYSILSLLTFVICFVYAEISVASESAQALLVLFALVIVLIPCIIAFISGIKFITMTDEEFKERFIKPNQDI